MFEWKAVAYLRVIITSNIRQQRRIEVDSKYKMEKFTKSELKAAIKNAIKPESKLHSDEEHLLKCAFKWLNLALQLWCLQLTQN